jgi:hypothetical protein
VEQAIRAFKELEGEKSVNLVRAYFMLGKIHDARGNLEEVRERGISGEHVVRAGL